MKLFFDSSAFAKRCIKEAGSEEVDRFCSQADMLSVSSICLPEIISALRRLKRQSILTESRYKLAKHALLKDIEDVSICNITPSVINRAVHILETSRVRALDALHIACALELEAEAFISSDLQQLSAARTAGLKAFRV